MNNIFIIYLLIIFFVLYAGTKLSYYLKLLDIPNKRKIHSKPTVYTGGLLVAIIYLISLKIFSTFNLQLNLLISTSIIISIVGFIDDKYHLNTGGKLSLQILPVFYLIFIENLTLNNIGEYNSFTLDLHSFSKVFTLLCVLFLINSFNYFDGIDGCLGFSTLSTLCILYFIVPDQKIKQFLIVIALPIIIFLFFNFSFLKLPKLFFGDSGSLMLGFILSFLLIFLANNTNIHPILLAWSVSIFVFEFLSINIMRFEKKTNLFKAGLDHLHYKLLRFVKSPLSTDLIIFILNIFLFIIGYIAFYYISPFFSLIILIFSFLMFLFLRKYLFRNKIS
jgi:UDP-GlcNAc:undecaprenyl-phosphate/decaprenyl-phosphate GlcNAc-1-phosphate transferase